MGPFPLVSTGGVDRDHLTKFSKQAGSQAGLRSSHSGARRNRCGHGIAIGSASKRLDPPEHDKHDDDEQHEPQTAAAIVTGAIEWTATEATEAPKQR